MNRITRDYHSKFDEYKGRYGERKCGYCAGDLPKRRRNWCSYECVSKIFAEGGSNVLLAQIVFKRDNWTCKICGFKTEPYSRGKLQCDHIIPHAIRPDKTDKLDNLQTLCIGCHKKKTKEDIKKIKIHRDRIRRRYKKREGMSPMMIVQTTLEMR